MIFLEHDDSVLERPDRLAVGDDELLGRPPEALDQVAGVIEQMQNIPVAGIGCQVDAVGLQVWVGVRVEQEEVLRTFGVHH